MPTTRQLGRWIEGCGWMFLGMGGGWAGVWAEGRVPPPSAAALVFLLGVLALVASVWFRVKFDS